MDNQEIYSVLNELDLEIISLETGASVEYIEAVLKETLSNNRITRIAKRKALTKLIEAQTEQTKIYLLTTNKN